MQTNEPLSSVEAFALALMEASSRLPSSVTGADVAAPSVPPADDALAAVAD